MQNYDVIIVGAGSMGMSAGAFLAGRGVKTLMLDTFDPPHANGSHHGETRLIRHAYSNGAQYVPLALRASELWHELEQETLQTLFDRTGVLNAADQSMASIHKKLSNAKTYSLPVEWLDADEMAKRWPGLRVPESFAGLFEQSAGVLRSEACIRAYRELAMRRGATLLPYTRVDQIRISPESVTVSTNNGTFAAAKLIVSAGAWTGKLLPDIQLPIKPLRKTIAWFQADERLYNSASYPGFTFDLPDGSEYYGFPSFDGSGVKVGRHDSGITIDPDDKLKEFGSFPEDEGDVRRFLETYMPHASGSLIKGRVCKYELTPDEDFIVDHHPAYPNVAIAGGFSGHGFKFASVIGEILADIAIDGKSRHDISLFSLQRFCK